MLDLIDALGDDSDRPGPDPASGSESNAAASCRSGDQSLERADAEVYLRRAPARDGDYFVVPRVVGE
jgi:Asp-tRNA(Asn)/Glu-tRNA(Gln) amidotransferase C subunit